MSDQVPALRTRRPTGKPPWPMILLAGVEKSGKSYSAAAFSASDLVDRTFWIEIGEGAADQYGALPGARYEIVEHDGTYRGIGTAIYAATRQPRENGKPHAIVIDSMTELWDLLSDEAQAEANARYRRKNPNKPQDTEAQITMDLWNVAKKRWRAIVDMLRVYDGPVILTSRLEQVAVIEGGKPTEAKTLKVRAEKNLPYEVDAIVQIPGPRQYQLTGVRSVRWNMKPGGWMDLPDFTVDKLLRDLGLDEVGAVAARSYTAPKMQPPQQMTVDQAVGQMRRNQGRQADDEWTTDAPAAGRHEPTNGQLQQLAMRVTDKFGITDRAARLAALSELLGRQITSMRELSYEDAEALLGKLHQLPDHIADAEYTEGEPEPIGTEPNPRNGDTGKPLGAEMFVPSLQSLLVSARGEGAIPVAVSLDKLIAKASTPKELEAIWKVVDEAQKGGHVTRDEFAKLNTLGQAKGRELSAPQPPSDAPNEKQYEVRDRFEVRIKHARTAEDCNDVAGALVESRDAGNITPVQFDALVALLDGRERSLRKAAGDGDEGWSHQMLAQSGAAL